MTTTFRFAAAATISAACFYYCQAGQALAESPYVQDWNTPAANQHVVIRHINGGGRQLALAPRTLGMPSLPKAAQQAIDYQAYRGGDYISEMATAERWMPNRMPLKVFIAPNPGVEGRCWSTMAASAMNEWCTASGGALRWERWPDPNSADITVQFSPRGTIGECGLTHKRIIGGYLMHAQCEIDTRGPTKTYSTSEIKKICLHEIGHALGLSHSKTACDIMYWQSNKQQNSFLGCRDTATIRRLYPTG